MKEITKETRNFKKLNENENPCQNVCNATQAVYR